MAGTAIDIDVPGASRRPITLLQGAAAAALVAGLVHYAVAAGHRAESPLTAWLLTAVGAAQIVWAVGMPTASRRRIVVLGGAVNAVALLVWASSRSFGAPLGDQLGGPLTRLETAAIVAEAVVAGLVALALLRDGREAAQPVR
jgi:hypothetical protein